MAYILSIDQGTTGSTACLIDTTTFEIIGKANEEFRQIFPSPGLVEHDLDEIWSTVENTIVKVMATTKVKVTDIKSIGITNQRETICAFSKTTKKPFCNAIVWQDRRTSQKCMELKEKNLSPYIKETTGLTLDPYFSATKIQWLLENNEAVIKAAQENDLYFGTIDTFLLYKLTGGLSYFTEPSNASRTLLMNLKTNNWDQKLLSTFKINKKCLPSIKDSFGLFGVTKGLNFLPDDITITGILGDQQAALFGQAGYKSGDMKCTYGTGAFMLLNTGTLIKYSNSGLLTTVAYSFEGETIYALEGSSYIAGAAIQWLRDNLNIIETAQESEKLASEVVNLDEMKNILFMPFFTGIGSPHWVSDAQATITGITRDTTKSHITRACLEGICFAIDDLICAMEKDLDKKIKRLKVDGGAVENNLLMSIQATISDIEILRPKIIETTVYGAGLAAAIGAKILSINELDNFWKIEKEFSKNSKWLDYYNKKKEQWSTTLKKLYL